MRAMLTGPLAAAAIATATIIIATIVMATTPLTAAPIGAAGGLAGNATPFVHRVQDNYYGGYTYGFGFGTGYNYIPACPYNYHYACWGDLYGYRHCGCLVNRW